MKFKVGDKVKIRKDLKTSIDNVIICMEKYAGKTAIIKEVTTSRYYLDIDDGYCFWSDEMLEPAEFTLADLKPCMVVKLRNADLYMIASTCIGDILSNKDGGFESISRYKGNMTNIGNKEYDIVNVYGFKQSKNRSLEISTENRPLLWQRIEKSSEQIELEELEKQQRELADRIAKVREKL